MSPPTRIVACPTCRKSVPWVAESRHRPFCSERCRLIDLGEWADENRRIPEDAEVSEVTRADLQGRRDER